MVLCYFTFQRNSYFFFSTFQRDISLFSVRYFLYLYLFAALQIHILLLNKIIQHLFIFMSCFYYSFISSVHLSFLHPTRHHSIKYHSSSWFLCFISSLRPSFVPSSFSSILFFSLFLSSFFSGVCPSFLMTSPDFFLFPSFFLSSFCFRFSSSAHLKVINFHPQSNQVFYSG